MIHRVKNRVEERVAVIVLKDTPEYRTWLQNVSDDSMIPMATIARDAIRDWALSRGYPPPPARCRFKRSDPAVAAPPPQVVPARGGVAAVPDLDAESRR